MSMENEDMMRQEARTEAQPTQQLPQTEQEQTDESLAPSLTETQRKEDGQAELPAEKNVSMEALLALFPSVTEQDIPTEVWESVREGVPIEAAYALYDKKRILREEINRKNAQRSAGAVSKHSDNGFFSPAEVRQMSPAEVRRHYAWIKESMKRWN